MTGCKVDSTVTGQTGLTVNAAGQPVLLIAVCKGTINRLYLFGPAGPDMHKAQKPVETWIASTPLAKAGVARVNLLAPFPGWTVLQPIPVLVARWEYGAFAQSNNSRFEAEQVNFSVADFARLDPATVLSDGRRSPVSSFDHDACTRQ
jgi:hypothetical protein